MNRLNFGNQVTNGAQIVNVGLNSNDKTIKRILGRADTTLNNNEFNSIYKYIESNYNWLKNRKNTISDLKLLGGK